MATSHKIYNITLLTMIAIFLALCILFMIYLDPLDGGLTRIGGYTENDFGWNSEQSLFPTPLAQTGQLDKHYDIVVFGDSFSSRTTPDRQTGIGGFWTDHLANLTGLSVGVFVLDRDPIDNFLNQQSFKDNPPEVFVLETVERYLRPRFADNDGHCEHIPLAQIKPLTLHPMGIKPKHFTRDTTLRWHDPAMRWPDTQLDYAINYIDKSFRRLINRKNMTDTLHTSLSRSDLMSNRRSTELLYFIGDTAKAEWSDKIWSAARCSFARLQKRIEANGKTRFVLMIVPDKSSVYAEYMPPDLRLPTTLEKIPEPTDLRMLRLDRIFRSAAEAGIVDLYMPDDTHWGSAGSELAAQVTADYLSH